jgi:hypothetical protein
MAAMHLAKLTHDTTGGASSCRDDQSLAGLRFGDLEEAEVGGEAVDAEGAIKSTSERKGIEGTF